MPGRKCSICAHPQRGMIDAAIAGGGSQATAAERFKISTDAIGRHIRAGHVTAASVAAAGATEAQPGPLDPLQVMLATQQRLVRVIDRAERNGHGSVFVSAARELRQTVIEIARMTGGLRADGSLSGQRGHLAVANEDAARERILAKLNAIADCHATE